MGAELSHPQQPYSCGYQAKRFKSGYAPTHPQTSMLNPVTWARFFFGRPRPRLIWVAPGKEPATGASSSICLADLGLHKLSCERSSFLPSCLQVAI